MQFNLFSLTLIIVSVLYLALGLLAIPFFKRRNSPSIELWLSSSFLSAFGAILISIRLVELGGDIEMFGVDRTLVIGQFLRFLGALGMLLFLRFLLRRSIWSSSKEKPFFLMLYLGGISLSIGKIFFPLYIPNIVIQIFLVFYAAWFIYIINELKKESENQNYLLPVINLILFTLIWATILDFSLNYVSKILIAENFFGTLSYTLIREVNFSLRAFATVIAFTIGFVFWVQNYSDLAEKNKLDDLKITSLLQEKDLLITNLTNQKMLLESGGLAVGLAHELNQYLGSIRLNVEQVIHANHSDLNNPFLKKSLERVLSANDQAATIIRNLKKLFSFSNTKENLDSIQLEVSVGEVANLYRERIKQAHIDLELNLPASRRVSVNDSLIRQVVVNLIANSI